MSVIIRLQNLPWSANSLDIRQYFRGLSIPEGGVHIVGGEMGDAFIAFSTDEDARQAMMLGGGKIKEVQISLMLSSRSEMQKIIEAARQASMSNSLAQLLAPAAATLPAVSQQLVNKDIKTEKRDSSDLSSSSHETGARRDKRTRSRSRSRDRTKKDRRDRDRRRWSRSRSRSRERRRRRSNSRSRGRDSHTRERERRDADEGKKDNDVTIITPPAETTPAATTIPNLELLNPATWQNIQATPLAQNAQLLTNIELLRNLAAQKGPLLPGGPGSLLSAPLLLDGKVAADRFQSIYTKGAGDFGGSGGTLGNQRGFGNFDEGTNQDSRFDRNRGGSLFQNNSGFQSRNGSESRFGGFGRSDNGFRGGSGGSRDRPGFSRGLLDFPGSTSTGRSQNRQDNFSNKDDKVDEFGRSIQLRNRRNAASSNEDSYEDEDRFQDNQQQDFGGFGNKFSGSQPNQRPPPLMRGRENWPSGGRDNFSDRRGYRGSYEDRFRSGRGKYEDSDGDCCVEIQNLAPQIAYGEVRRPFSSMKIIIKEIKFFDYGSRDKKCRIRFLNNDNKKRAIQSVGKIMIDHKPVQLIDIDDSDFDECVDEGVKRPDLKFSDDEEDVTLSPKDAYVQIKGLPLSADEKDVANLFPNVVLDRILLEVDDDEKTKCAYLKFQKPLDAKVALGTPNRTVGDSLVFLTQLPQYAFNDHLNKVLRGKPTDDSELPDIVEVNVVKTSNKTPTNCIQMKNLPVEANDRDICDFFSDIGLVPNKIHIMLDGLGQPTGNAFCEFSTPEQLESACTKNSAHLGKSIVSVSQVPRTEMLEALEAGENEKEGRGVVIIHQTADGFGKPQCVVALENIPFRAGTTDIVNFFGWSYRLTENDILRRYNERGQPTGDGRVCFRSPEDAMRAVRFLNNRTLMGRPIRMKIV